MTTATTPRTKGGKGKKTFKEEVGEQLQKFAAKSGATVEIVGDFSLEPPLKPGDIPERVILELRQACAIAVDYAGAFSDACKAQAEKHGVAAGALKRYIKALEGDKIDDARKEADDLLALIAKRKAAP